MFWLMLYLLQNYGHEGFPDNIIDPFDLSLRVDDLEHHFECAATFVTPNLQPDLVLRNSAIMPEETLVPFHKEKTMLCLVQRCTSHAGSTLPELYPTATTHTHMVLFTLSLLHP